MARLLSGTYYPRQSLPFPIIPYISSFYGSLIAVLSIISLVVFLCGSNKTKKSDGRKIGEETANRTRLTSARFGSKAFSIAKAISWRKLGEDGEDQVDDCVGDDHDHQIGNGADDDHDESVWRKPIMLGERCRPLDFSGKIVYDSQGNLLQELPAK